MARPTWKPENATPEQRKLLNEAIEAAQEADRITAAAEDAAWAKIEAAREAGVPMRYLAARTKRSKSTAYRKLGAKHDEPRAT